MSIGAYSINRSRSRGIDKKIFVLILLLAMYSCGTLSSFTSSWTIVYLTTVVAAGGMLMHKLYTGKGELVIDRISVLWMLMTIVCAFNSLRTSYYQDLIMSFLCTLVIMLFNEIESGSLFSLFPLLTKMAVFFTLGELWQYFFTSAYYRYLYPLFGPFYQQAIRRQFYFHRMCTGFTSQTVVSAEFIIIGVCAVYCMMPFIEKKKRFWFILLELFFIAGVLLTGKRSSPLLLIVAYLFVETRSTIPSKRLRRLANIVLVVFGVLMIAYFLFLPRLVNSRNSIVRYLEYMQNDEADISNGRFGLYRLTLEGFSRSPLLGNGWAWVKKNSSYSGAHNIYLQLLCECGIIGSFPFFAAFAASFFSTLKNMRAMVRYGNTRVMAILKFSLFTQTFILAYGMVGNPIYDYNFLIWYVLGICMNLSAGRIIVKKYGAAGNRKGQ